jgi:hypothetical protein
MGRMVRMKVKADSEGSEGSGLGAVVADTLADPRFAAQENGFDGVESRPERRPGVRMALLMAS